MQTVTEIEFSPELSKIEHGLASLPPDSILQYEFDFKSDRILYTLDKEDARRLVYFLTDILLKDLDG